MQVYTFLSIAMREPTSFVAARDAVFAGPSEMLKFMQQDEHMTSQEFKDDVAVTGF